MNNKPSRYAIRLAITAAIPALALVVPAASADNVNSSLCGFSANVQFNESAPRDSFLIKNTSSSDWNISTLALDMTHSAGNLIFDVTAQGAGVEVFQPFRADDGPASLVEEPRVMDGDQRIVLALSGFSKGVDYRFTIDVDDQLTDSALGQIRVAASEMSGAELTLGIENATGDTSTLTGVFDDKNSVIFEAGTCQ